MKYLFLLTCFIFQFSILIAQHPIVVSTEKTDSILSHFPAGKSDPGYAVMIIQDGRVVYHSEAGMATIKKDLPITQQSQINIGSVTKQFTAAAILLLEEEGKLQLSDEIHKYIPELTEMEAPVTLQQLLTHTGGIRDHFEMEMLLNRYSEKSHAYSSMLEWMSDYPELNFTPGDNFAYTNTGFMLLAMVIERVSSISYADFLAQNIFAPLHMDNTYVETGKTSTQHDGTTHYYYSNNFKHIKGPYKYQNGVGAVGVMSTMHDMYLWDQNFYHNHLGKGSMELIKEMEANHLLNDSTYCNYGYGLILKSFRSNAVIEHSGGWGEYLTQIRRFPDLHLTVMVMCNSQRYSPFLICDEICKSLIPYKPIHLLVQPAPNNNIINQLTGSYFSENNVYCKVVANNNTLDILKFRLADTVHYQLQYVSGDQHTFHFIDSTGTPVQFDLNDSAIALYWQGGSYFDVPRTFFKEKEDAAANRAQHAGKYYSNTFGKSVRIRYNSKKDELRLFIFPEHYTLVSRSGSTYLTDDGMYTVHFTNDRVTIGNEWLLHVDFTRK